MEWYEIYINHSEQLNGHTRFTSFRPCIALSTRPFRNTGFFIFFPEGKRLRNTFSTRPSRNTGFLCARPSRNTGLSFSFPKERGSALLLSTRPSRNTGFLGARPSRNTGLKFSFPKERGSALLYLGMDLSHLSARKGVEPYLNNW